MDFTKKYRPDGFDDVVGNDDAVQVLQGFLQRKNRPHSILFVGEHGCGKTTLARIFAANLGCEEKDIKEINSSNNRGIDTARDIQDSCKFKSLGGGNKIYILDECFLKDTKIYEYNKGYINIQRIKRGDIVSNFNGEFHVKNIKKNKVKKDRICKLYFSDGSTIVTTVDHEFFTNMGWIESSDLCKKNIYFLKDVSHNMYDILYLKDFKNESKNLSTMQRRIFNKKQKTTMLFYKLFKYFSSKKKKKDSFTNKIMWFLWEKIQSVFQFYEKILFFILCRKIHSIQTEYKEITNREWKEKLWKEFRCLEEYKRIFSKNEKTIKKNEIKQPYEQSRNGKKNDKNKEVKRYIRCFEKLQKRKWLLYFVSIIVEQGIGLGIGISNIIREKTGWISYLLQSRYRKSRIENWDRDRWEEPQFIKAKIKRYKERRKIKTVWLEDIKVYKSGSTDKYFWDIEDNKKQYEIMYDLEIYDRHNYIANGFIVHNCHRTTKDFQNAMLKVLEEPPEHVYFILCTTDPQGLLKTVKSRCVKVVVERSNVREILGVLQNICDKEKKEIKRKLLKNIAIKSEGHVRDAIKLLEKIIDIDDEEKVQKIIEKGVVDEENVEIIELCRCLLNGTWKQAREILNGLKEQDSEKVRRIILGYMSSVLLNSDNPNKRAGQVMSYFVNNFYDSGFSELVLACFSCFF